MAKEKILLVEDDVNINELVKLHLENNNYQVDCSYSIAEANQFLSKNKYNLILLDLMLPDGDGMSICNSLRAKKDRTPIILLTAKTEEIDKVLGLEMGADDYITKPFGIRETLARIKALIRRSTETVVENEEEVLDFGSLIIYADKRKVVLNNKTCELTKKEFELLYLLAKHKGNYYSRGQLLDIIWGYQFEGYEHTVNSHINRLRNKIEKNKTNPKYIITTWGVGYKFNDEL